MAALLPAITELGTVRAVGARLGEPVPPPLPTRVRGRVWLPSLSLGSASLLGPARTTTNQAPAPIWGGKVQGTAKTRCWPALRLPAAWVQMSTSPVS